MPVVGAAGTDFTPSMSARATNGPPTSFQVSTAGVAASMPVPAMGQMLPVSSFDGTPGALVPPPSSAFTMPETIFGEQLVLPQFGELSLRTPKFEPPTISR